MDLIQECGIEVHPVAMMAIIEQESGGNPYALNDNTGKRSYQPKSMQEAAAIARRIIAAGGSVDIGLAQINSKNLKNLKMTVEDVLDPCKNLKASEIILKEGWLRSGGNLKQTLSAYNTGKLNSTVGHKYAERVIKRAKRGPKIIKVAKNKEETVLLKTKQTQDYADIAALEPVVITVEPSAYSSPLSPKTNSLVPEQAF